ncbi:MAG: tRNA (guanosine(37)-N1)-methyltransferase TrmD [Elusimicrobia bacterium]|nr:MAG: tRNA (guanosine(37)-N1)-methyltransferase TrmD [Elusimicrobiota bacterium]
MRIDIVTLFPSMFEGPLTESIVKRAREKKLLEVGFVNPRDFATDRHNSVDDRPYGGGAGMVLMAGPMSQAIRSVRQESSTVVFLSPQGQRFDQGIARSLAKKKHLVLVCGRYEGIDERLMDLFDMELSIGDYVLTGGELPAMVVTDALSRLQPGVLKKEEAAERESFSENLLDYPQYTRPETWEGKSVPPVLLSGDHAKIEAWRQQEAETATRRKRPELLEK